MERSGPVEAVESSPPASVTLLRRCRAACLVLGSAVSTMGLVPLVGWILGHDALKGFGTAGITVKANTSIALVLSGLALLVLAPLRRPTAVTWLGRGLALLVAALGVATMFQHVSGVDLGIDQLLFHEEPGAAGTQSPNRMGPPASTCFPLLGIALFLLDRRTRKGRAPSQALALVAILIALVPILGYVFGVEQLYGIARHTGIASYTGIALHTAIAFVLLASGILLARADASPMRQVTAADSGGILLRRMLPAAILLPIALGRLRVLGEELGWYDTKFGRSLLVLSFIVLFSSLTWWTARAVSRHSRARARAETAEQELRARLERALKSERRARGLAEHSNRMKDEFLATLSHELRSPLNAILGWSHVLVQGDAGAKETRQGLQAIERNSRLQAKLIEDLLDMSRIVSGTMRIEPRVIELRALVESVLAAAIPEADAKGIRVEQGLDPRGATVRGDPDRLQQVISNLISNAIKFTPSGGRVGITLRVEVGVELEVSDTGIGIDPIFLPHVFDRFRQADSSTTRRHGGLGLGLAIAKQLVDLHGGTLRATSAGNGRGATFTLQLPRAKSETTEYILPTPEAARADEGPSLAGLSVLVVDDQADARVLVERVLSARGARVVVAESTEQALVELGNEAFDVLISDVSMPGRDGYDLVRHVRSRTPDLPAIALTAFARREDEARALAEGYSFHLAKPVGPARLVAAVARLAHHEHGGTARS